jgi:ABC-2 type transport system ATP-binding protein
MLRKRWLTNGKSPNTFENPAMTNPLIQLQAVNKKFGRKEIFKNLHLEIFPGSIVSLLGVNGAGKSTLIKIILGLEKANGKIRLQGYEPQDERARRQVGVILQDSDFIDELTARETLRLVSLHYENPAALDAMIRSFSLAEFIDKRMAVLSQGQKRRVALALAFVGNPKIVFLDEPTAGLDVQSRIALWNYIKAYRKPDTCILLTTHYLEEAQFLSDRIVILHEGSLIADGSVEDVCQKFSAAKVQFKLKAGAEWQKHYPQAVAQASQNYFIESQDTDNLIRMLVRQDIPFCDLQINKNSLEDIFVKIVEA